MKDKIINMGDNEIIVSYDEKTKLVNVSCIVGQLGDVCGDVVYVSGCVEEVGFNVGLVCCNVNEVGGNVGKVGGKIGSVIEE